MKKSFVFKTVAAALAVIMLASCTARNEEEPDVYAPETTVESTTDPATIEPTPAPADVTPSRPSIIYVDLNRTTNEDESVFQTVQEAMIFASRTANRPRNEDERITVIVYPGLYREQVTIMAPFITLEGKTGNPHDVTITWYYGVGYVYNNVGPNGFFYANVNWDLDSTWEGHTRHELGDRISTVSFNGLDGTVYTNVPVVRGTLGTVDRWGPTVNVLNSAHDFTAKHITFENSFNFHITQEELDAGVRPDPSYNQPQRNPHEAGSTIVQNQNYNERASAFHSRAQRVSLINSRFYGRQNTIFVDGTMLFYRSFLAGGVDYVFGNGTVVFYHCTLMFVGDADSNRTGTITASSIENPNIYGLLFWHNTVDYARWDEGRIPSPAQFGRPWREHAQVTFFNTTVMSHNNISLMSPQAWGNMSNNLAMFARFFEFGTTNQYGAPLDQIHTMLRPINTRAGMGVLLDEWQILEFNPRNYLRGWDPLNFGENLVKVDAALEAVNVELPADGGTVALPISPDGVEFHWRSDSNYIVVADDFSQATIAVPAEGTVTATLNLFARDNENGYGDRKSFTVTLGC